MKSILITLIAVILIILIISLPAVSAYQLYFYHNDLLGSPRVVTDLDGNKVWSADYMPFGQILNEDNSEGNSNYKYNSKELDSSGLYYYGARYYDADIGRFTQPDPLGGENVYVYTSNNPLKFVDPSGMEECDNGEENSCSESSENPRIDFVYPSMEKDGVRYTIGGEHHITLDRGWYEKMVKKATSMGIDPYFYIAFTILEYGGIRPKGQEQQTAPDLVSRVLSDLRTGFEGTLLAGAGCCLIGDAKAGGTTEYTWVKKAIEDIGGPFDKQSIEEANDPNSPLNQQSFILLKRRQEIAEYWVDKKGLYFGLQTAHGVGKLPRLFEEGNYPRLAGVSFAGRDLPLYGKSMSNLMISLHDNPAVGSMVPTNADTPIMNKVLGRSISSYSNKDYNFIP